MVPAQKILDTARERNADIDRPFRADHAVARGNGARRAARCSATGFTHAAPDRRRDDVARAHGGQDRAALRRARPSTCPTRRARSAWRAACCPTSSATRTSPSRRRLRRGSARSTRRKKGPTLISLAAARANAFKTDWARYAPPVPTFIGRREFRNVDLARARAVHRLGTVLPGVGVVGPVSGDPRRPGRRRGGAQRATPKARRCSRRSSKGRWLTANGVVGFWPANRDRRRHRALRPTNRATTSR